MLTLLFDGIAYGMLLFVLRQRLRWVMTSPAVRAVEADREPKSITSSRRSRSGVDFLFVQGKPE